jgi:hypothetical protein
MSIVKLIAIFSLVGSASAFTTPSTTSRASDGSQSSAVDVQAPTGILDPLGLTKGKSQEQYDRLRGQEIKHGHVAMLAVVGYLVTYACMRLPGLESVPAGWGAWEHLPVEAAGQMAVILIFMDFANRNSSGKGEFPGDFRNRFLDFGWEKQTNAWKTNSNNNKMI